MKIDNYPIPSRTETVSWRDIEDIEDLTDAAETLRRYREDGLGSFIRLGTTNDK